jgi:hypothetical protein
LRRSAESKAQLNQANAIAKMADAGQGGGDQGALTSPVTEDPIERQLKQAQFRKLMAEADAQELENEAVRAGLQEVVGG